MDRKKQIENASLDYNWCLKERGIENYPNNTIIDAFSEGVEWADDNPSGEVIMRINNLCEQFLVDALMPDEKKSEWAIEYKQKKKEIRKKFSPWDLSQPEYDKEIKDLYYEYLLKYVKNNWDKLKKC